MSTAKRGWTMTRVMTLDEAIEPLLRYPNGEAVAGKVRAAMAGLPWPPLMCDWEIRRDPPHVDLLPMASYTYSIKCFPPGGGAPMGCGCSFLVPSGWTEPPGD